MKKIAVIVALVLATMLVFAACAPTAAPAGKLYIPVISKGFQHQFWQAVKTGADKAGVDLGVEVYFNGPEGEAAVADQVNMFKAELAKKPKAIALAAVDAEALLGDIAEAQKAGIPIIGFDSGVPGAPTGAIVANASTNNEGAAGLAASEMMKVAVFTDALKAATEAAPARVVVFSQDAVSGSIVGRTQGFVNQMLKEADAIAPGAVAVEGNDKFNKASASAAKIIIQVVVPATSNAEDVKNSAMGIFNMDNVLGIFCSNEGTANGILTATNDGSDLDRTSGKYKTILVAGFDAGSVQKNAVKQGWFFGSVTQDPVQIGYQAVALAVKAANGEAVADIDTGAKWYTAANMDEADIAILLYD